MRPKCAIVKLDSALTAFHEAYRRGGVCIQRYKLHARFAYLPIKSPPYLRASSNAFRVCHLLLILPWILSDRMTTPKSVLQNLDACIEIARQEPDIDVKIKTLRELREFVLSPDNTMLSQLIVFIQAEVTCCTANPRRVGSFLGNMQRHPARHRKAQSAPTGDNERFYSMLYSVIIRSIEV